MRFASDNWFGAAAPIVEAVARANKGVTAPYGEDELTQAVEAKLAVVFEREVRVLPVATGTAANSLALSLMAPGYGAVFCHEGAHVLIDECGAPEFFTGGAKLVGVAGDGGKVDPGAFRKAMAGLVPGDQHHVQAAALSLTQATELGTIYTAAEIAALSAIARERGMKVHMDGARFANALVASGASAAELTWGSGVDILSFGATKNGVFAAEAVVLFDTGRAEELMYRRKRGGHLVSKGWFLAAQLDAYLEADLWLDLARHANAMAQRLATGVSSSAAARLAYPTQANEVFVVLPRGVHHKLRQAGAIYHVWPGEGPSGDAGPGPDEVMVRLVTAFATETEEVDRFLELLG